MAGEVGEDVGVVLEEVAGEEVEGELADFFSGDSVVVAFDAAIGGAHEQGGGLFEGLGSLACFVAEAGEGGVDFLHGDRALDDVDLSGAAAVWQEADGTDDVVFGAIEVGGDF